MGCHRPRVTKKPEVGGGEQSCHLPVSVNAASVNVQYDNFSNINAISGTTCVRNAAAYAVSLLLNRLWLMGPIKPELYSENMMGRRQDFAEDGVAVDLDLDLDLDLDVADGDGGGGDDAAAAALTVRTAASTWLSMSLVLVGLGYLLID